MRKILGIAVLLSLSFGACQQTAIPTEIPALANLKLVNGNPISDANYDDYNPVMVQLNNGTLVLVFISSRPCAAFCINHSIFVTTSATPYLNDGKIPAFRTPQVLIENTSAIDLIGPARVAVQVNGNQVNIYHRSAAAGSSIYTTTFFDPVANTDIQLWGFNAQISAVGLGCSTSNMLGLDTSNNMISVASTNAISRYNPASYSGNCNTTNMFANTSLSSALRLSPMRSATIGIPEGFLVTESGGKLSAQTASSKGPQIKSFTDGLAAQGLTLTGASVLNANQASGDLLVFSASPGSGKPSDLYVLTNKTPADLWLKYVAYGNQPTP